VLLPIPSRLIDHDTEKTPVELQAIQTREFDSDKSRLVSVFITVFQDAGYIIDQADLATGLITARAPVENRLLALGEILPNTKAEFLKTTPTNYKLQTDRTFNVLVTDIAAKRSKARVSINIQLKITPDKIFAPYSGLDTNADQYQAIFSKAQQGLFLKKNIE